jgi:hypothetical protein
MLLKSERPTNDVPPLRNPNDIVTSNLSYEGVENFSFACFFLLLTKFLFLLYISLEESFLIKRYLFRNLSRFLISFRKIIIIIFYLERAQ